MLRRIAIVRAVVLATAMCTLASSHAYADFLMEPFFAWTRNSDTGRFRPGGGIAAEVASGWFLAGGGFGYASAFFDPKEDVVDLIASSYVLTVEGHAGITRPARSDADRYFPYATGGFGFMRQHARDRDGLINVRRTDPAFNVGGGIRVLMTEYLGIRADVRYFRSMTDPYENPDPIVADLKRLGFWRIGVGAVIRFGTY